VSTRIPVIAIAPTVPHAAPLSTSPTRQRSSLAEAMCGLPALPCSQTTPRRAPTRRAHVRRMFGRAGAGITRSRKSMTSCLKATFASWSPTRAVRSALKARLPREPVLLWSAQVVEILAGKLREPPSDDFRASCYSPQSRTTAPTPQVAAGGPGCRRQRRRSLSGSDDLSPQRSVHRPAVVHAKIGIVDDAWLMVGSANLSEPHSSTTPRRWHSLDPFTACLSTAESGRARSQRSAQTSIVFIGRSLTKPTSSRCS
jgi:hypothetical protein